MNPTSLILSPRSSRAVRQVNGAMRVLDIPGIGSFEFSTGPGAANKKYVKSPWAYACMQIRGWELANLPWEIVRIADGSIVEDHPLKRMLEEFGAEGEYREAMHATEIEMCVFAKGFWLNDGGRLERLAAVSIKVERDPNGIQGFTQTLQGRVVNRFAREEIVYFKEFNPDNQLDPGPAVLDILKNPIGIEYESALYTEAFFKNDATPALLLSTEQTVPEPEMEKMLSRWVKKFRGSRQHHEPAFADRGLKAHLLSPSMKDIALVEIRDQARNDICAGMRVPKILVGAMEEATYANAQEARKFMLEDHTIPRSAYYAERINADLTRWIDPAVRFRFAPEQLPILQEGANAKNERLAKALELRVITPEFYRLQMGWPETATPSEGAPIPVTDTVFDTTARAWIRKAKKALKAGKGADVDFETDEIPEARQAAIRARLASASTAAEVEEAFALTEE